MQPIDAMAAVLDGGLLGASETGYVGRTALLASAAVLAALLTTQRAGLGLLGIWLSLKCLSLGRTIGASLRYLGPASPLSQTG